MRRFFFGLIALALVAIAGPSFADNRDFDIVNATGYPIKGLYVDESSSPTWSDNEVSGVFKDGDTMRIRFGKGDKGCKWDIKVVWDDGSADDVWHDFDLCQIDVITLKYDRSSNRTWAETR